MTGATERRHAVLGMVFSGMGPHRAAWRLSDDPRRQIWTMDFAARHARAAERAGLDLLLIADNPEINLATARTAPVIGLEPVSVLGYLAACTESIGLVGTLSTTYTEPYNVARMMSSLDHISGGRAAWNIVTSVAGAGNYGMELPTAEERYAIADEATEVVRRLWLSWDDDALALDAEEGVYADPDRIHPIGFRGAHFRVDGALNLPPTPQTHPVIVQAGSSGPGQAFAAKWAEVVFTAQQTKEDAREFSRALRAQVAAAGRDPGDVKILVGVNPTIGETDDDARATLAELNALVPLEDGLGRLSRLLGGVDLSGLDPSRPIPAHLLPGADDIQARRSRYEVLRGVIEGGASLREVVDLVVASDGHFAPVGSPETIADVLCEWLEFGACDGFMVFPTDGPSGVFLFTDRVMPVLRERGVAQPGYRPGTLREKLGLPAPR